MPFDSSKLLNAASIKDFLTELGMQEYEDALSKKGYDDLNFMRAMSDQEMETMCTDIEIVEGYKMKLKKALLLRKEAEPALTDNVVTQLKSTLLQMMKPYTQATKVVTISHDAVVLLLP